MPTQIWHDPLRVCSDSISQSYGLNLYSNIHGFQLPPRPPRTAPGCWPVPEPGPARMDRKCG